MGRRIGYFESLHRANLKKQEREAAAAIREQERRVAAEIREQERIRTLQINRQERENIRKEREMERQQKRAEKIREREIKEKEKQEKIEQAQNYASDFANYLENLQNFHQESIDWSEVEDEFSNRLIKRSFKQNKFLGQEPTPYQLKDYQNSEVNLEEFKTSFSQRNFLNYLFLYLFLMIPTSIKLSNDFSYVAAALTSFVVFFLFYFIYNKNRNLYVKTLATDFLKIQHLKKTKFEENEMKILEENQADITDYENAKLKFEAEERALEAKVEDNEERRLDILIKAKNGDPESIGLIVEDLLPLDFSSISSDFADASPNDYEIGYFVQNNFSIQIQIHLPSREIFPKKGIALNNDGTKSKIKTFSEKERDDLFKTFVASFVFFHTTEILKAFPYLQTIILEASVENTDPKTGCDYWKPELQVIIETEKLQQINLQKVNPVMALENFDLKHFFSKGQKKVEIQSIISENDLIWANENDDDLDLPYGLLPGQNDSDLPNKYSKWL